MSSWRDLDIWNSQKLGKAQLDSNQGAFLGLQNKFWSFDLQVRIVAAGWCLRFKKSREKYFHPHCNTLGWLAIRWCVCWYKNISLGSSLISKFAIPLTFFLALASHGVLWGLYQLASLSNSLSFASVDTKLSSKYYSYWKSSLVCGVFHIEM